MEFHLQDIILSLANIVVLFFLLRLILWKHVTKYLAARSGRIQKEKDDAAAARAQAEEYKDEYKKQLAAAEKQGQEIINERRHQAEEEAERIIAQAREAADKLLRDARFRIEIEKSQALKETQDNIARLATEMASRILAREVSVSDNDRTVSEFFEGL